VPIQAVFFDVHKTLIYPDPPVPQVYADALGRAGIRADVAHVNREFEKAWRRLRRPARLDYGSTEREAQDWWRVVLRETFASFGQLADFEGVFEGLWEHFASGKAWRIYGDVKPAFEALRRLGKGIGVISNWDVRLERILRELGLLEHFQWFVVSCAVGAEKPSPVIFRRALALCSLPAGQAVHVGDSYEEDVLGARATGMLAIWLRRDEGGAAPPAGVPVVKALTELPDLVKAL
jgi:putative hydrolase of the HAD superfamily